MTAGARFTGVLSKKKGSVMLGFCVAFFDPYGYKLPRQHATATLQFLVDTGFPVSLGQVVRPGDAPLDVPSGLAFNNIYESADVIFYKENLWNLAAQKLDVDHIMFIDSDVYFRDKNWLKILRDKLDDGNDCIQLFSSACWESQSGKVIRERPAVLHATQRGQRLNLMHQHPGFGFFIQQQTFNRINGFFDRCIHGDGDSAFIAALFDDKYVKYIIRRGRSWPTTFSKLPYQLWRAAVLKECLRKSAPDNLRIYHRWHGDLKNRQYNKNKHKKYVTLDPARPQLLKKREDGLLQWVYPQPEMINMWKDRQEDGPIGGAFRPTMFQPTQE